MMFTYFLNGTNPEENVWCADKGTYSTQSTNATCGAQGIIKIYFYLNNERR